MSKFYAHSGSHAVVINAPTAEAAAVRLIDQVFAAHDWIYDDQDLSDQQRYEHLVFEALLQLDSAVSVSEKGFSRSESGSFEVPELLQQWHKLMTGLTRLLA